MAVALSLDLDALPRLEKKLNVLPFLPDDVPPSQSTSEDESDDNVFSDAVSVAHNRVRVLDSINNDLSFLLHAKKDLFWALVLGDESILTFVDTLLLFSRSSSLALATSSLSSSSSSSSTPVLASMSLSASQSASTTLTSQQNNNNDAVDLFRQILKRTLFVLLRCTSFGETNDLIPSQSSSSSKASLPLPLGEVLYDNWIFDIPKLFDICGVFGPVFPILTKELVHRVFWLQPTYYDDLEHGVQLIVKGLTEVSDRLDKSATPTNALSEILQVISHLHQLLDTISSFAWICADDSKVISLLMGDKFSLLPRLAKLYDVTLPLMLHDFQNFPSATSAQSSEFRGRYSLCQDSILTLSFVLLRSTFLEPLAQSTSMISTAASILDSFIQCLQGIPTLQELQNGRHVHASRVPAIQERFFSHLNNKFSVFDRLQSLCASVKMEVEPFTVLAVKPSTSKRVKGAPKKSGFGVSGPVSEPNGLMDGARLQYLSVIFNTNPPTSSSSQQSASSNNGPKASSQPQPAPAAPATPALSADDIQKLANQVCELFPLISRDFATECLKAYKYDLEQTLTRLLDDSLPPHLAAIAASARSTYVSQSSNSSASISDAKNEGNIDQGSVSVSIPDENKFQQFLNRTGRVAKSQAAAMVSTTALNAFDSENDLTAAKASLTNFFDSYDDEYDDTYDEFMSFQVDETAVDVDMHRNLLKQNPNHAHSKQTHVLDPAGKTVEDKDEDDDEDEEEDDDKENDGDDDAKASGLDSSGTNSSSRGGSGGGDDRGRGRGDGRGRGNGRGRGRGEGRPPIDLSQRSQESLRARQKKDRRGNQHRRGRASVSKFTRSVGSFQ